MPVDHTTLQRLIRPLPADEYDRLVCPSCAYDVRQTLIDGFAVCPECGTPISVRTCKPRDWEDSPWAVAFMFGVFLLPTAMVLASPAAHGALTRLVPRWGLSTTPSVLGAGALALSYPLVVAGYRVARQRMGEHPPSPAPSSTALWSCSSTPCSSSSWPLCSSIRTRLPLDTPPNGCTFPTAQFEQSDAHRHPAPPARPAAIGTPCAAARIWT